MKKLLPILIIASFLALPLVGLAQEARPDLLDSCKITHSFGKYLAWPKAGEEPDCGEVGCAYAGNKDNVPSIKGWHIGEPGGEVLVQSGVASFDSANNTLTDNSRTEPDGFWIGFTIKFISGENAGAVRTIISFVAGTFEFASVSELVKVGDAYELSSTSCSVRGCKKELGVGDGRITLFVPPQAGVAMLCLLEKIETFTDWIFVVLLIIAAIFILWGAIEFITSAGDPEKVTAARNKLIWALVGVVVAFVSKGLVRLVAQIIAK